MKLERTANSHCFLFLSPLCSILVLCFLFQYNINLTLDIFRRIHQTRLKKWAWNINNDWSKKAGRCTDYSKVRKEK